MNAAIQVQFSIPEKCHFVMALDSNRRTQRMIAEAHQLSGFYEGGYSLFVAALLHPGDQVVDVGAHVGYFSLLAASVVGKTGRVHAFEPAFDNADFLKRNIELNQFENIRLSECLVGNDTGTTVLHYNSDNDGGHAVWDVREYPDNVKSRVENRCITVPITTLDAYFESQEKKRIRFMKIDAEGSEFLVLKGAAGLLADPGVDCVMWERNESALSRMGCTELDIRTFAAAAGFDTWSFMDGKLSRLKTNEIILPGEEINLMLLNNNFVNGS